jgi:hypothetical protein
MLTLLSLLGSVNTFVGAVVFYAIRVVSEEGVNLCVMKEIVIVYVKILARNSSGGDKVKQILVQPVTDRESKSELPE